jgi:coenzyme Q-binding protein COQ10
MGQAEFRDTLKVDQNKLYSVVTHYESYPEFVEGCTSTHVKRESDHRVQVKYEVNVMSKNIEYTLEHREDPKNGRVEWSLIESNFFKKNSGKWELRPLGEGKTEVLYSIDLEFKVPVPGFILNRLVKGSLPSMVKSFEEQAKKA